MANEKETKKLEDMFGEVEAIIKELESPDIKLEDAFAKYKAGMDTLKACGETLDKVEKEIRVLSGDDDEEPGDA